MSFFQRIRNLWHISSIPHTEWVAYTNKLTPFTPIMKFPSVITKEKKIQEAIFIKRHPVDPIEEILKQDE